MKNILTAGVGVFSAILVYISVLAVGNFFNILPFVAPDFGKGDFILRMGFYLTILLPVFMILGAWSALAVKPIHALILGAIIFFASLLYLATYATIVEKYGASWGIGNETVLLLCALWSILIFLIAFIFTTMMKPQNTSAKVVAE